MIPDPSPRLLLRWLLGLTLLRLLVAAYAPLSPDEAYYWIWSRALAGGYVDHPPMVAVWIAAGTALAGPGALGVRLLAPFSAAIGTLLLADAAERVLPGRRAGLFAALALNATLMFGVGAVTMTPDTPLLFFWTATLWAGVRLQYAGRLAGEPQGAGARPWFPVIGICAGLALLSKYTAVFLGFGLLLWLLLVPALRRWLLRTPWPGLGGLMSVLLFSPVLLWNAEHGWASFARQGGRVGVWQPARAGRYLGELLAGQIGLATPLLFLFLSAGIGLLAARAVRRRGADWCLLALLGVPPVLVFLQHALGDRVQGNWPAIVYPAAAIGAAALEGRFWQRLRLPALALGFGLEALICLQAGFAPLPLPPHWDPALRLLGGWDGLADAVETIRAEQKYDFVVAEEYGVAAEMARHLPAGVTVLGADPRWALFALPHPDLAGKTGLLLVSDHRAETPGAGYWAEAQLIGDARRAADGVTIDGYRLYRVTGRGVSDAIAALPRP